MDNLMKDSGIAWIGNVPKKFEIKRVSDFFISPKKITKPGRKDVLSLTLNGVIEKDIENNKGLSPESYDTYQIFKKNDLVFKLIDLENYQTSRVGIVWKDGIMSSAYIRLSKKKNTHVDYFFYQFFDLYKRAIFNMLGGNGVRSAINRSDLLKLNIIFPPKSQQNAIANYLDHHTSRIDKEISLLEKKVEKLDEYKQALIYETVTKGLDKNVKMKDSGIEWIGMIPEHWEVKRVKDVYVYNNGYAFSDNDYSEKNNGNYLIKITHVTENGIQENENLCINVTEITKKFKIQNNSILYALSGATAGKTCFFENSIKNFYLNQRVAQIKNKKGLTKYLFYMLNNKIFSYLILNLKPQTAQPNIGKADLDNSFIPFVLDINEQQSIANYLDEKCSKIDNKKELVNKKIELLKEYKQSLIYEAVTGKINIGE